MLYFVLQRINFVYTGPLESCKKDKIQAHSFDMDLVWIGLGDSEFVAFFMSLGKVDFICFTLYHQRGEIEKPGMFKVASEWLSGNVVNWVK